MKTAFHCILLGCTFVVCSEAFLTTQQERELLDAHNLKRQQVDPPASYMPDMKWSSILADSAQKLSDSCQLQGSVSQPGSKLRSLGHARRGVGENMFVVQNTQNLDVVVDVWFSGGRYYDYTSRSCYSGRDCSSYTQLVWATSTDLGCGITYCPRIDRGRHVTRGNLVVCLYGPAGNLPGRPPYPTTRSSEVDALLQMILVQGANEKDTEELDKAIAAEMDGIQDDRQQIMWQ